MGRAYGVSDDGSVAAGLSDSASGIQAFLWTSTGGMIGLGDLPGGTFRSQATGISADGSVVVGRSNSGSGAEAFLWTSTGGMIGLGDLPGGAFDSRALGVSADGSVVVGYSESASGNEAFRWTSTDGIIGLGDLPGGGFESRAQAASAEGSVVVGFGFSADGYEAFIWDETNGMRTVKDVLENDYGLDLTGWGLIDAADVSDDGLVLVGSGINPSGDMEAWLATLDSAGVPATSLLGLIIAAVGILVGAAASTVGRSRRHEETVC
jgi:probable HAF family extracellular repeat protein